MNYKTAQKLGAKDFKRRTGVHKQNFKRMLHAWHVYHLGHSNAGCSPLKDVGGLPNHGNDPEELKAGCRFDYENPEHRT